MSSRVDHPHREQNDNDSSLLARLGKMNAPASTEVAIHHGYLRGLRLGGTFLVAR
jgi:hypothetical protein